MSYIKDNQSTCYNNSNSAVTSKVNNNKKEYFDVTLYFTKSSSVSVSVLAGNADLAETAVLDAYDDYSSNKAFVDSVHYEVDSDMSGEEAELNHSDVWDDGSDTPSDCSIVFSIPKPAVKVVK